MTSAVVYDLSQTAYLFSMVSNSVSDSLGTAPCLAQQLTDNVNKFIGYGGAGLAGVSDWTITWGPGVYQSPTNTSHLADNAAVVVFSPTLNTYILAIAGTNPQDCYDWLTEDIDVGPNALVNFPIEFVHGTPPVNVGVQGQSQVSLGTALGLYGVLQEMSGASLNTGFVQLQTYLATLTPGSGATLIVAGHSLGGALSAALGLQIQLSMVPSFKVTPMLGVGLDDEQRRHAVHRRPQPRERRFRKSVDNLFAGDGGSGLAVLHDGPQEHGEEFQPAGLRHPRCRAPCLGDHLHQQPGQRESALLFLGPDDP